MEHVLLQVGLCENDLRNMCGRYHFEDTDISLIKEVYQKVFSKCKASVYYKKIERVSGQAERTAAVIITLGKETDSIQNHFMEEGNMSEAYMVECLAMELLTKAYEGTDTLMYEQYGLCCGKYLFPGADCPLSKMTEIFDILRQEEVVYNEAFMLVPKKSVVYITTLQDKKPEMIRGQSLCAGCERHDCINSFLKTDKGKPTELNYGYQRIFGKMRRD